MSLFSSAWQLQNLIFWTLPKDKFMKVTKSLASFGMWSCKHCVFHNSSAGLYQSGKIFPSLLPGVQTWDIDAPEELGLLPFLAVGRSCTWKPKLSQENSVSSAGICSVTPLEIQRHKWINNSFFLVFFICIAGIWWCFSRSALRKNFRGIFVILSLHAPAASKALYKTRLKSQIWHGDLLQCEFNQ